MALPPQATVGMRGSSFSGVTATPVAITTDAELQAEVGKLATGNPTNIPAVTGIVPTVGAGENIAAASGQL